MSNMSYCRFENTAEDLGDCVEALDDIVNNNAQRGDMSETEITGIAKLASQAWWITELFNQQLSHGWSEPDVEEFMAPWKLEVHA